MAKLYNTTKNNISIHIKNIFECGELDENINVIIEPDKKIK